MRSVTREKHREYTERESERDKDAVPASTLTPNTTAESGRPSDVAPGAQIWTRVEKIPMMQVEYKHEKWKSDVQQPSMIQHKI